MALELAEEDPDYEGIAIQTYEQFMAIANAIGGFGDQGASMWDEEQGFFKDLVLEPGGKTHRVDVYSWVGLIPLFAAEVVDERLLRNVPRFRKLLEQHAGGVYLGNCVAACPAHEGPRGEHLLALVDDQRLRRILERLLNEDEFLSRFGVRSVSRLHATHRELGILPGVGQALIEYVPGESTSGLFGGNSNWRGPIWMPTNYTLIQALEKFHRFYGDEVRVRVACMNNREMNLGDIATMVAERLVDLYRRDRNGELPIYPADSPFQNDPHWKDLLLFYEYFHAETGLGLGAMHQTGWTGLLANLVTRRYRKEIPVFWRERIKPAA